VKTSRGAALPTVLTLVFAVLVIGLAMGSLSTLSLQLNGRQLETMRAEMAARSALAHLLALLRKHDAESELNPLNPRPFQLNEVIPEAFVVEENLHTVTVHFDTGRPGFSRDNLGGDAPAVGWADHDDVPRIPPFALDIVLNVEGPSSQHSFRVELKRVWPFALYAKSGPVALMSLPTPSAIPTTVKGDIYTSWLGEEGEGGILRTGYGFGHLDDPSKVLANLEARAGFQPHRPTNHHLIVGMPLGYNTPVEPADVHHASNEQERLFFYRRDALVRKFGEVEDQPNFSPETLVDSDRGNRVEGDFVYNHKQLAEVPPYIHPGSSMEGRSQLYRGPSLDPLAQIEAGSGAPSSTFDSAGFQRLALPLPDSRLETEYSLVAADLEFDDGGGDRPTPYLLSEDLVLTPGENSTGGPISTHYEIDRSVSNRQVLYNTGPSGFGEGLYVRERQAGMRLQDTVLHVKGDLDLSLTESPELPDSDPGLEIVGAGATIIVDGQLILGNAHINAQDQGFVLYARDIVLKGGGTFFGLMIAENSITILSQKNNLEIRGALMCAGPGGITLKGTTLEHDPEYLKSINGGGDFAVVSWRKL
jgi:hypothetical protein